MVTSYVQLLQRRYKDKLDQDANEFIGYAVQGAERMRMLITGLLAYSRVTTHAKEFEPTDCEEVFLEAVNNLRLAIAESGAVVTNDPLPTVPAPAPVVRPVASLAPLGAARPVEVVAIGVSGTDHWLEVVWVVAASFSKARSAWMVLG